MCMALLQNTVRACGIGTRVRFCPLGEAENLLKTLLPCGRAAVFADEGAPLMRVRARLAAYRPVCCVVGKEPLSGLFSLPDEVRAVVALGRRSIFAARFFASLRGGFVLAVPLTASAEGLFEAALPKGYAQAGYPLRAPDVVLADETLLAARAEAVGFAALSALCAEDLALHALFAGGEDGAAFVRAAEALPAGGESAGGLFCVCSLLRLALRTAPAMPAVRAAEAAEDGYALFFVLCGAVRALFGAGGAAQVFRARLHGQGAACVAGVRGTGRRAFEKHCRADGGGVPPPRGGLCAGTRETARPRRTAARLRAEGGAIVCRARRAGARGGERAGCRPVRVRGGAFAAAVRARVAARLRAFGAAPAGQLFGGTYAHGGNAVNFYGKRSCSDEGEHTRHMRAWRARRADKSLFAGYGRHRLRRRPPDREHGGNARRRPRERAARRVLHEQLLAQRRQLRAEIARAGAVRRARQGVHFGHGGDRPPRRALCGKRAYLVGTDALKAEFAAAGVPLAETEEGADVAVLGYDTSLTYEKLVRINRMLVQGKPYIATHADDVCPAEGVYRPTSGRSYSF